MSTISASTTTTTAYVVTADTTGALVLQTGATPTTALTIDTSQNLTLAGTLSTTGITNTGVATAARFNPTGSSVTGTGMYLPAANSLGLSTNGTNAVYINSSQNVGIGTASPADKLDVTRVSSSNSTGGLTLTNTDNSGYGSSLNWNLKLNSTAGNWGRIYTEAASTTATFMAFQTTVGSTLAESMRIDSSGVLLVNTTARANAPDHTSIKLAVAGEAHLQSQGAHIWFGDSTNAAPLGVGEGLVNTFGTDQDFLSVYYRNTCRFFTGTTEAARFDNSGNLLVGATSTYNSAKVSVNGDTESRGNMKSYYSTRGGIATATSFTLFSLPTGSYGAAIGMVLYVQQRNDNVGALTNTMYIINGWGGSGATISVSSTQTYSSGSSFSLSAGSASGNLTITFTNTSGATSTSINMTALCLTGYASITWGF